MARAAAGPPLRALAQCSTRSRVPKQGGGGRGGDVAGGVDVRVGGAQRGRRPRCRRRARGRQGQARGLGELGARGGADADEDVVRRVLLAVVGAGGQHHAVLADDLGEPGAEVEADAVLAVQLGEDTAHLGTEDRVQRGGRSARRR